MKKLTNLISCKISLITLKTAQRWLCTFFFLTVSFTEILGQEITVSGEVIDEKGPLQGVSVKVQGTALGVVTDEKGTYRLSTPNKAVLVFSSVGYSTQIQNVNNQQVINVTMAPESESLNEVVVVGYGTLRKRDLTGAVASVDIKQQRELPNVSVYQSLQGSVAGLNVGAVDQSGTDPIISIRGQNTLSNDEVDSRPLVVVDGIIYRGNVVDLNPASIESIEVLKDGSAASIYGSQASNGVILVTSKKGIDIGKPIISYSGQYTLQVPSNKLRPRNTAENKMFLPDVFWTQSRLAPDYLQPNPEFSVVSNLKTLEIAEGFENNVDNDWWGLFTGNGRISSHDVSIRGRSKNSGYFIAAALTNQKGFIENDDYRRVNLNANFDSQITDWLMFGLESFLTTSDYSGESPSLANVFHLQPFAPIFDDKGEYVLQPDGLNLNPYLQTQTEDEDKRLTLFGNFHFDVKLPFLKGFNYRINYGNTYRTTNHNNFDPWGANFTGAGFKNSGYYYGYSLDNIFTYTTTFQDDHRLNLTVLYGKENIRTSATNASASNFLNPTLGYNRLQAGDPALNIITSTAERETSLYSMGRAVYSFKDKYLLTATVRRDGFSGFGEDKKFGLFPSIALGWVISEEGFLKNNQINFLKLRGSYGQTGRRGVGRYETLARINSGNSYIFGDGGATTIGQWISTLQNTELGWETTIGLNVGVDFDLFRSRLSGNIEYYNNNTRDILYNIQIPEITGFSSIATNIGKVHNYGLEISLNGQLIKTEKFNWRTTFNYARNRNEIQSILGVDNDGDGREDDIVTNRLFIGEPQRVVFDYEITGMWQLTDDVPTGFLPGTYKLADINADGLISTDDRKILGYQDPAYRFSIGNTFSYKNVSLYVFINSIQGGKNFYYGDGSPYQSTAMAFRDQLAYSNAVDFNYWMPENSNAKYRRLDVESTFGGRPYDQRNFVRLQDVSLAYQFNSDRLKKIHIRNLKVNISAKNLMTWTNWEGWDPETGVGLEAGLPVMKSYTLGLNVEF